MMTDYVKQWFARGDEDLALVNLILEKGTGSPNLACFHAQQTAEKYLKGFLAHHDLHVRKVHDLELLLEDCKSVAPSFSDLWDNATFLNKFYIESRYPDDYIEFPHEDVEKAYDAALRIKEFVLAKISPPEARCGFGAMGILMVLGILVTLIGGGIFTYQNLRENPEGRYAPTVVGQGSTRSPQPMTSEIDTSTWKTYRNEEYGFEVKYPVGWEYNATATGTRFQEIGEKYYVEGSEIGGPISITVLPGESKTSHEIAQKRGQLYKGVITSLFVAGEETMEVKDYLGTSIYVVHEHTRYTLALVNLGDESLNNKLSEVFEDMTTTFKFIK